MQTRWLLPFTFLATIAACGDTAAETSHRSQPEWQYRPVKPCTFSSLALSTIDSRTVKADGSSGVRLVPGFNPNNPRKAVDQIVTYALWRGWGSKDGDRAIVYRKGPLIRDETFYIGSKRKDEPPHHSRFANLETGATVSRQFDSNGSLESVSIGGPRSDARSQAYTLTQTEAFETIAGEQCASWIAHPKKSDGVTYSACITSDGVVLRDTAHYRDGKVMEERRALKVERRNVLRTDVLPPRELLDWNAWTSRAPIAGNPSTGRPINYALTLSKAELYPQPGARNEQTVKTYRANGPWVSEANCSDSTLQDLKIFGPTANFGFFNDRFLTITHNLRLAPIHRDPPLSHSTRKAASSALGEECEWYDSGNRVMDYSRDECRTKDGVPMMIDEISLGSGKHWDAAELKRGQVPSGPIRPPARLLDWRYWGWPEVAGAG